MLFTEWCNSKGEIESQLHLHLASYVEPKPAFLEADPLALPDHEMIQQVDVQAICRPARWRVSPPHHPGEGVGSPEGWLWQTTMAEAMAPDCRLKDFAHPHLGGIH